MDIAWEMIGIVIAPVVASRRLCKIQHIKAIVQWHFSTFSSSRVHHNTRNEEFKAKYLKPKAYGHRVSLSR